MPPDLREDRARPATPFEPSAPGTILPERRRRDPALDLLRAIALARVVAWHTYSATWLTFFAAIPIMFFVAGTLLVGSRQARSYGQLVARRARRLLVPLWAFGAMVAAAGAVHAARAGAALTVTRDAVVHSLTWAVPLVDPTSAAWHGGWLTDHLWYLRAYLWIVLLAPVFAWAARRLSRSLAAIAVGVVILGFVQRLPFRGGGQLREIVGDLVVYGGFAMLGMAYARRKTDVPARWCLSLAGVFLAGTVAYVATAGLPGGDVNESYPAVALVGMTWLLLAGAAQRPLRHLAARRPVAAAGETVSRYAETVYLWHPVAIIAAYGIVGGWQGLTIARLGERLTPREAVEIGLLTVVFTVAAALLLGWIEAIAARRPVAIRRVSMPAARAAVVTPLVAVMLAVGTPLLLLPAAEVAVVAGRVGPGHSLRPPSYREALGDEAFAAPPVTAAEQVLPLVVEPSTTEPATVTTTTAALAHPVIRTAVTAPAPPLLQATVLKAALRRWIADQPNVGSVAVAVGLSGEVWAGDASRAAATIRATDKYAVASITKSFTIGLVLQQVAAGTIDLDAPMPALPGVAPLPDGVVITPRELLEHTSGLVDYSMADGFDQSKSLTPADAVSLSVRTKLLADPGALVHYANSNYLWLGLLLEKVTGRSYHDLVASLSSSLGLKQTELDPWSIPGWVGFSSGGIHSTLADVSHYEEALYTPGRLIPANLVSLLTTLDKNNVGLGTWPLCPCGTDPNGTKTYTAIGHYIANGGSYHYPDGMSLVVHVDPPSANSEALIASLGDALRAAVPRR